MQVEVHFAKIAFWGVQGSKNSEIFAVFRELEIGKLSRVHLPSDFDEIWFQCRKYIGPRPVEVHFAKFAFWGVQGSKNAEILITG